MGEFPNKATQFSSTNQPENNGRPKGSKSLAKIIRELEDDCFDWDKIPVKQLEAVKQIGSPFRVIVYKALQMAIFGDIKAMEYLRKSGYGDKLDITSDGKKIEAPVIISAIQPRDAQPQTETTEGN